MILESGLNSKRKIGGRMSPHYRFNPKDPIQMMQLERKIMKLFFKQALIGLVFSGLLLGLQIVGQLNHAGLIVCAFVGVLMMYLFNNSQIAEKAGEWLEPEERVLCFFDEEVVIGLCRIGCSFFREVGLLFLLEPIFQSLLMRISEESIFHTLIDWRWIIVVAIILKDLFYLIVSLLVIAVQKSTFNELKEMPIEGQISALKELRMEVDALDNNSNNNKKNPLIESEDEPDRPIKDVKEKDDK